MNPGFLEDLPADCVLDGFGRFDEAGKTGIHPGHELLLPAEQASVTKGHQHDHDRVGARKMLGLATRTLALPAAVLHRRARAAIGAIAMAIAESCSSGTAPCIAMPRNSVTATSSRAISFSTAVAEIPMPKMGAPSRKPRKIVPGLAPSFTASSRPSSTRGPSASCLTR